MGARDINCTFIVFRRGAEIAGPLFYGGPFVSAAATAMEFSPNELLIVSEA